MSTFFESAHPEEEKEKKVSFLFLGGLTRAQRTMFAAHKKASPPRRLLETSGVTQVEMLRTIRNTVLPLGPDWTRALRTAFESGLAERVLELNIPVSVFSDNSATHGQFSRHETPFLYASWKRPDGLMVMDETAVMSLHCQRLLTIFSFLPFAQHILDMVQTDTWTAFERSNTQLMNTVADMMKMAHDPSKMDEALRKGWWPFIEEGIVDPHRSSDISDISNVHMIRCRLVEPRGTDADDQFRKLIYAAHLYHERRKELDALFQKKKGKGARGGKKKDDDAEDVTLNDRVLAEWLQYDDAPPHHYHLDRLLLAMSGASYGDPAIKSGVIIDSAVSYKRAGVIHPPSDELIRKVWNCKYPDGYVYFEDNTGPVYTTMFDDMQIDYEKAHLGDQNEDNLRIRLQERAHDAILDDDNAPFMDVDDDILPDNVYPAASQSVLYGLHDWMDRDIDDWASDDVIQAAHGIYSFYATHDPNIPLHAVHVKPRVLASMYFIFSTSLGQFAACSTSLSRFSVAPFIHESFSLLTDDERIHYNDELKAQTIAERRRKLEALDPSRALALLHALECTARMRDPNTLLATPESSITLHKKESYTTYAHRLLRISCLLHHQILLNSSESHRQAFHVPTYQASRMVSCVYENTSPQTFLLLPLACAPWNFVETPRVDFLYSAKDAYLMLSHAKMPRTLASLWGRDPDLKSFMVDFVEPFYQSIVAMSINLIGALVSEVDASKAESMPEFPEMEAAPPPQFEANGGGTVRYSLATPFRERTVQMQLTQLIATLSRSREQGRLENATHEGRTCEMEVVVSPSRMDALREASQASSRLAIHSHVDAQFSSQKTTEGVQNFFIRNNDLMMLRFYHDRLIELTKAMSASAQRTDHPESKRLVASLRKMLDAVMRDNFRRVILSRWHLAKLPEAFRATLAFYSEQPNSDFGKHSCFNALDYGNLSLGAQSIAFYGMFMTEIARLHSTLPLALHLRLGHNASGRFQQSTTTQRSSLMIFGRPSTGKSLCMKKTADTAVPSTTLDLARFTTHAFSTNDTVLDGYTIQLEEVGQDMLGGKQGDNVKITAFKQRIESALVVTYAYDTSDKARASGSRASQLVYCSVQCTNILASNEKIENVDEAILSRFIVIIVGEIDETSQVKGYRMGDQVMQGYRDEEYERVASESGRTTLRLENCMVRTIHAAVQARVIPDVSMDIAKGMAASVLTRAMRSASHMKQRMARLLGHIINILYTLTITRAASMCMTEGLVNPWKYHHPGSRRREYMHEAREDFSYTRQRPATRPHSLDVLLTLAPRFMYTTKQDLIMALTMIRDDIDQRLTKQIYQFFISQLLRNEGLAKVEVYRTLQTQHHASGSGSNKTQVARYNYNYLIVRPPEGHSTTAQLVQWVADTMGNGASRLGVQQISHILRDLQSSNVAVQPYQDLNRYKYVPPWDKPLDNAPSAEMTEMQEEAQVRDVQHHHAILEAEDLNHNRMLVETMAANAPLASAASGPVASTSGTGGGTSAPPAPAPSASSSSRGARGNVPEDPYNICIAPIESEENMTALIVREEDGRPYFAVLDSVLRSVYQSSSTGKQGFLGVGAAAQKLDDPAQWASFLDNVHTAESELIRAICHVLEKETLERYPDHVFEHVIRSYSLEAFKAAYGILIKRYGGMEVWDVPHLKAFVDKCPFEFLTALNQSEDAMRDCYVHLKYGMRPETSTDIPTVYRFLRTLRLKRNENASSVLINNTLPLRPAAETLSGPYGAGSAAMRDANMDRVKRLEWDMDYLSYVNRCEILSIPATDDDMVCTLPWVCKIQAVYESLKTGMCAVERGMRAYPDFLIETQLEDHMNNIQTKKAASKKARPPPPAFMPPPAPRRPLLAPIVGDNAPAFAPESQDDDEECI